MTDQISAVPEATGQNTTQETAPPLAVIDIHTSRERFYVGIAFKEMEVVQ